MIDFDEMKRAVALAIDENFICSAEEHCRNLEYQLDRIEKRQEQWVDFVNTQLVPFIKKFNRKQNGNL